MFAASTMSFLFKRSDKSRMPDEVINKVIVDLNKLPGMAAGSTRDKLIEHISKYLAMARAHLFGSLEENKQPTTATVDGFTQAIAGTQFGVLLIRNIAELDFEARKDGAQVLGAAIRHQVGDAFPAAEMAARERELIDLLIKGYEDVDIALNVGHVLRDCLRHENVTRVILMSPEFNRFFDLVSHPNFDVASDAFACFRDALTRHKALVASYLEQYYDHFFTRFSALMKSDNYVTKRQSVKLLGEILLEPINRPIMHRFISNVENLKLSMILLRDKSKNIEHEAFHVFKVIAANPYKPVAIKKILFKNQEKMIQYLEGFLAERNEDAQFVEDKETVIARIAELNDVNIHEEPPQSQV